MTLLTLTSQWRHLPGFVHGLPQRALLGGVRVQDFTASDGAALQRCLGEVLPLPSASDDHTATALGLVRQLLIWCGALQRHARVAVCAQVHARQLTPSGHGAAPEHLDFAVALPCSTAAPALDSLKLLVRLTNALHGKTPSPDDHPRCVAALRQHLEQLKAHAEPGFNLTHLLLAAFRQNVPVAHVANRVYRLGTGAKARLMDSTVSDRTSALGVALAQDKWLSTRLLRTLGLPVTENELANSADEAVAAAQRLGYPVVVKPADRDQGKGVSTRLASDEAVRTAWQAARAFSERTLVERFVPGWGHRITVHDGQVVGLLRRRPGGVVGDGHANIAQLIATAAHEADARGSLHRGRVSLDDEAHALLAEQGLVPDSVPDAGHFVVLRQRDNLSAGGQLEHLDPAAAHRDNLQAALRAAKAMHLDLAGVDLLCPDITRSWRDVGGAICEVNARPQFGAGLHGDNYDRVLRRLLGDVARIPTQLLLVPDADQTDGDPAPTLAALQQLGQRLGLQALSVGPQVWLSVDGATQLLTDQLPHGFASARAALADRDVPSLLMVLTPEELLQHGLPVDRVDALQLWAPTWPAAGLPRRAQALALCEGALPRASPPLSEGAR